MSTKTSKAYIVGISDRGPVGMGLGGRWDETGAWKRNLKNKTEIIEQKIQIQNEGTLMKRHLGVHLSRAQGTPLNWKEKKSFLWDKKKWNAKLSLIGKYVKPFSALNSKLRSLQTNTRIRDHQLSIKRKKNWIANRKYKVENTPKHSLQY